MKTKHTILAAILLAAVAAAPLTYSTSAAAEQVAAAPAKANYYTKLVDIEFVKKYAVIPVRADVMIIDSRPAARKYDIGHIPGAVNIPDTQFDELAPKMLPPDKSTLLIFYCEGPECTLSHKGALRPKNSVTPISWCTRKAIRNGRSKATWAPSARPSSRSSSTPRRR